jgi:hypothetical protein
MDEFENGGAVLTIFTTAKAWRGHSGVIQRNAVQSWQALRPRPDVMVFGDDAGSKEICEELGFSHVPDVAKSSSGTPLLSDMFARAHERATTPYLAFVNADIVLPPRTPEAVRRVSDQLDSFLLVGRRIDIPVREPIDFADDRWFATLERLADDRGRKRSDLCIDWFVFPANLFREIPPFAVGRTRYDNWLIWRAADEGGTVVDGTEFVTVLHQDHDYRHVAGSLNAWEGEEARRAEELLGHWTHYHSIAHARRVLDATGDVVPARGARYMIARPRRVVAHALRFSRPWRRRARLLAARRPRSRTAT